MHRDIAQPVLSLQFVRMLAEGDLARHIEDDNRGKLIITGYAIVATLYKLCILPIHLKTQFLL